MAKLTREQKIEIYNKRIEGYTWIKLSKMYGVNSDNLRYLCRLIDYHGVEVLRNNTNRYYSNEFKQQILNEVLIDKQSICSTAIKYGLSSSGMLVNWIKLFKENGYTVINKKQGRPKKMKNKLKLTNKPLSQEEQIKHLEEENLYLKAENEYLKKLRAVVEQREKRLIKKKLK